MGFITKLLGGGTGNASAAAEEAEAQRRAEISAAQQRVEGIFGSAERDSDILDLEDAVRAFLQGDLDRKRTDTARNLKFDLARSGLSKGSVDVDSNKRLGDDFLRGILEVERRSKAAGTNLRSQDQATKSALFSQILGGLDSTTAANQATSALTQNIDTSRSTALQQGIGNMFSEFTDIFKINRVASADRRAASDLDTLFGPRRRPQVSVAGGTAFTGG